LSELTSPEHITEVWRNYWDAHGHELGADPSGFVERAVREQLQPSSGMRILEAGSGTGGVAKRLAACGASVTLLDIVPACVAGGIASSPEHPMRGVVGDLFAMPFADDTFDAIFNVGVMEHFLPADLQRGLAEMARVVRPGGRVVCLVPSARARLYRWGKRQQERSGEWPYGPEYPQRSLAPFMEKLGMAKVAEFQAGVRHQSLFLRGWRRRILQRLVRPFDEFSRLGVLLFGGYMLVSAWEKPAHG